MQNNSATKKPNWFKINRSLHRDIGYYCIGLTLIFSISGIAVNHIDDWNPNYKVTQTKIILEGVTQQIDSPELNIYLKKQLNISLSIKATFWESPHSYKLFLNNDTNIFVDFKTQEVITETIRPRPLLQIINHLHLNELTRSWTYFSDLFAVMLIFLSLSALFMIKGKNGVTGKRGFIVLAGFISPLLFLI